MPQYQIEKISNDPPREWQRPQGGIIYYYKVKFVGIQKPISIGKTKKDSLSIGMTVDGTIEPNDGPEDKFKAAPMNQGSFGGGGFGSSSPKPSYGQKTDEQQESIARSVALKAAVDTFGSDNGTEAQAVLALADKYLAWLQGSTTTSSSSQNSNVAQSQTTDEFGEMPPDAMPFEGSEIPMGDIPF